jgi:predicted nucleic acid-binding protein
MLVVDAGVLAELLIAKNPAARAAFLKDPDWAAPPLWRSDFRRAIWSRISEGELKLSGALRAFDQACQVIGDNEVEPDLEIVLDQAFSKGLDLYDAEYVAVAQSLGAKLLTFDPNLQGNPFVISSV